jgi:hypothetical protein
MTNDPTNSDDGPHREYETPHHVPDWLRSWETPDSNGDLRALLLDTHHKLLIAATTGPGRAQYLAAAKIVSQLATDAGDRPVVTGMVDIHEPVHRCLTEVMSVLTTWDSAIPPYQVNSQFDLARGWATHSFQLITAGRNTGYANT